MKANESTINRLLLQICNYEEHSIQMIKGYNSENNYVYTKHILKKGKDEVYFSYRKKDFILYLVNLWQSLKEKH